MDLTQIKSIVEGFDGSFEIKDLEILRKYLVKNKADDIIKTSESTKLFIDLYSPLLKSTLGFSGIDVSRTLTTDNLSIWLQRAIQICAVSKNHFDFASLVTNDDAQSIFTLVCDFWTDSGVAFGNALKELFTKIISLVSSTRPEESYRGYLEKWTLHVLSFGRDQRVLYFMIEILAKKVGGSFVIEKCPELISQALAYMNMNALANPIGKALFSIYSSILYEWSGESKNSITCDESLAEKWTALWAEPTRAALMNEKSREHIQIYFLPQMFKKLPQSLKIFIRGMSDINFNTPENKILLLLGCMKLGQERGILDVLDPKTGIITEEFLQGLLHHNSPAIKLGALAIISTSQQVSKPIPSYVFKVLENSLDDFLIESDPGFRNQFYGFMRQFVFRLRASSYAINREYQKLLKKNESEKATELGNEITHIKNFISWFISYLERCLRPNCPYQFRYTSLLLIQLLAKSGLDDEIRPEYYEKHHEFFPFNIPVYNKNVVKLLIDNISNNYEDVRSTAAKILEMAKLPLPLLESYNDIDLLVDQSLETVQGLRGREGDAAARGLELAFKLYYHFPSTETKNDENFEKGVQLIEKIIDNLEAEIEFSNKDFFNAVLQHPVHGYFTSLTFILEFVDFSKFAATQETKLIWAKLVQRMIACLTNVWDNVKDILCHDSPEGNLPEIFKENYSPELETKYGPASQVLLSYSWRAIKESATMLKVLFDRVPLDPNSEIFSNQQIITMGGLLLSQLATVKHRGAFSSVYPTFISCCKRCNKIPELSEQPEKWLSENIDLIQVKAQYITRRSGGLPYLITAVLTAEIESNPRLDLITKTFNNLLNIAKLPAISDGDEKMDLPQVHAFNCIKVLFIEANLSSRSAHFIEPALELSIVSFSSDVWAIRNCAVMLFTALQNRLFGTAKKNQTKSKHTVSTISAKIFFNKYKSVKPTLLKILQQYVSGNSDSNVETVFPVLSLLSRLESTVGYSGLDEFKPLIIHCLESKVWKVRQMAARVIPPLLRNEDPIAFVKTQIGLCSLANQNKLHGVSMASFNIIVSLYDTFQESQSLKMSKIDVSDNIVFEIWLPQKLVTFLIAHFEEFVICNPSSETAIAFFRVLKEIYLSFIDIEKQKQCDSEVVESILTEFDLYVLPFCEQYWNQNDKRLELSSSRRVLLTEMANLVLVQRFLRQGLATNEDSDEFAHGLKFLSQMIAQLDNYETQLMALKFLDDNFDDISKAVSMKQFASQNAFKLLFNSLWEVFSNTCFAWDQVRGPAARVFSKIFQNYASFTSVDLLSQSPSTYQDILFKSITPNSSEEINEACLESLGVFSGFLFNTFTSENGDTNEAALKKWMSAVSKFGNENEEFPSRNSAMISLGSFLSTIYDENFKLLQSKYSLNQYYILIDTLFELFLFLSDDDEEIREAASKYAARLVDFQFASSTCVFAQKELLYSYIAGLKFIGQEEKDSNIFPQLEVYVATKLVNCLTSNKKPFAQLLKSALSFDSTLFTFERQNLFRDDVTNLETYGYALKLLLQNVTTSNVEKYVENEINLWISKGIACIEETLNREEKPEKVLSRWVKDIKLSKELSRLIILTKIYNMKSSSKFNVEKIDPENSLRYLLIDF